VEIARANILGIGVSAINYELAVAEMERWIQQNSPHYVCVATVNALVQCQNDEGFRRIHNAAGLVTPDGMPLVWLSRLMGFRQIQRVYGPDLLLHVCGHSVGRLRHYFYGGRPRVAELLATKLGQRFPGLIMPVQASHPSMQEPRVIAG
jgi:N-acetylglucosaminyldiphosphoundecaprenol N-acetyl-beta-D-mannosaminyltransferase